MSLSWEADDSVAVAVPGDRERARSHLMAARAAWRQLDFATATTAAVDEVLLLSRPEDHFDVLFDATILLATLRLNDDASDPQAQRLLQLAARLSALGLDVFVDAAIGVNGDALVRVVVTT
jgi:hypothetical protein